RTNANKILLSTLKNPNIITILYINSWDRPGKDPKVTYNLVQLYIAWVTNKVYSKILAEYLAIKRTNFNTIASFLIHAKFKIDNNFEITFLYNAIKTTYPIDTKY
ncbi:hypothetical protein GE21DRAFT_1219465, partial [Neurospora crassa]